MSLEDRVEKGYHKFSMKDLNYEKPYREIPLGQKAFDLTGINGLINAGADYSKNYYRSLIKDHPKGTAVANWGLQWGSAAASFGYGYVPVTNFLKESISNIVGTYGGGQGILGDSLAPEIIGAFAPALVGIPTMYIGFKRHNPVLVGAGAAWSFGSASLGFKLYPYLSKLLAPVTAAPIFPIIVSALAVGVGYQLVRRMVRPIVRWFLKDETHKEPEKKQAPVYNLPDNKKPAPSRDYQKAA